jgi:hypothetical protein
MIYLGTPINFLFPFSAPLCLLRLRVKNSSYANFNSHFKAEAQGRGEKKGDYWQRAESQGKKNAVALQISNWNSE